MSWVRDTLEVYGRVLRRATTLAVRHWWLGLVLVGYVAAFIGLVFVVSALGLGMLGGIPLMLARAALMSSGLVLLGYVVRDGRAALADIPGSFVVYFGDVITFFFLLFALQFVAVVAFAQFPYAAIVFQLALLVFLNAVPEQIYLGRESGTALFVESYKFMATYWIEWLPATGLLLLVTIVASSVPFLPVAIVTGGIAFAFMFIARGLLFLELTTSSRRARDFQRRANG